MNDYFKTLICSRF